MAVAWRSCIGGGTHLSGKLFESLAQVYLLHIPYRGSAPAMADVLGGQVQMIFADVPTMQEAGLKGYEANSRAERKRYTPGHD